MGSARAVDCAAGFKPRRFERYSPRRGANKAASTTGRALHPDKRERGMAMARDFPFLPSKNVPKSFHFR
jgi:hypothetical protein